MSEYCAFCGKEVQRAYWSIDLYYPIVKGITKRMSVCYSCREKLVRAGLEKVIRERDGL